MSKLEKLIQQYCPDGVEYVRLDKVANVCRGTRVVKSQLSDTGYPVYQNCLTPMGYFERSNCNAGTTFVICGGAAGNVGYTDVDCWAADDCEFIIGGHQVINRYIYYYLMTKQNYLLSKVRKASIPRLSPNIIKELEIPVPPLPVQEEIVRVLDAFTELQAELQAELQKRKQQYNFYRDNLLNFKDINRGGQEIKWMKMSDVCGIKGRIGFRGYTRNDQVKRGEGALSLSPSNISNGKIDYSKGTYITWTKYDESPEIQTFNGDIIFCKTASIGKVAFVTNLPCKATINPQLVVLKDIKCSARFLSYFLETNYIQNIVMSLAGIGSVPNISQKALSDILIPIPPLEEQNRIVAILDRFDTLTNDLTSGLPAEMEKRRQQYEFYRDKLLTFKRKEA